MKYPIKRKKNAHCHNRKYGTLWGNCWFLMMEEVHSCVRGSEYLHMQGGQRRTYGVLHHSLHAFEMGSFGAWRDAGSQ